MDTNPQVYIAILEREGVYLGAQLDFDTALTLVAVASEDPACWEDFAALWPRYRTPVVSEFVSGLPLEVVEPQAVCAALKKDDDWIVIDLVRKRILTGSAIKPFGRDQVLDMAAEESEKQKFPLSIHFPPWWELIEDADSRAIDREREVPLAVPRCNRAVLFGTPLVEDLARRILEIAEGPEWKSSGATADGNARHAFTIRVHRDWLMTPREDLEGRTPRHMLHGVKGWLDRLADAQRLRYEYGGEIVAAEIGCSLDDDEPMGGEERVIYFDLCRELIGAGWEWCVQEAHRLQDSGARPARERELREYLSQVQQQWLHSPLEGGSPPRFIIECSRRRVPRGAGIPIVGMTEQEPEEHLLDCNCPICIMMAEGSFGAAFASLDGFHLDLDDEFAFSTCETREEWEEQQQEFAEMSSDIDCKVSGQAASDDAEPDEFASIWQGQVSDERFPGDSRDHLRMAFMMAEIVGTMEFAGASREDIRHATESFSAWRHCDREDLLAGNRRFGDQLESLASRYPELVSRVADLQSRLHEQARL